MFFQHFIDKEEKNMKKIILIVGILFLLGGCATGKWTHATKNEQDFIRDKYECEKIAEQSAANWGSRGNIFMISREMERCMKEKFGYTLVNE